jgi:DNA repair exonuclease SbcCD ATPase subunit
MASFEENLQSIIDETSRVLAETHSRMNSESLGASDESAFGIRDGLLVKCRNAIEVIFTQNLHIEIEEERRKRREIENLYREVKSNNLSLEHKLKETSKKLTIANQDLEILSAEILELKREMKHLDDKTKKQDIKQLSSTQSLMNQNSDLLVEIEDLKSKLAEKHDIMEEWTESVKMFEKKLEQLEEENKILRIECEEWQNKFKDISHKCDRLTAQAKISDTLKADLKRAQEDYEKYLNDERKIILQKEEEMIARYVDLEQKLKETYKERENDLKKEMTETIEEIHRNMQLSSKEHIKTRNENIALKDENKTLSVELAQMKKELETSKQTVENLQFEVQNLTESLRNKGNDYKAEISKNKTSISKSNEEIEGMKILVEKANERTRRAEKRLEDLELDLDSLSEKYNQASAGNLTLMQELDNLKEDYRIALEREKSLKETLKQKEESHKEYISDLIEEHERNLETHIKNQLAILEKEKMQNKLEIDNYKQIILKNEETIRKILQERNKVETSLKDLETFVNSLKLSFKEQQIKAQESTLKSSDQISLLTLELQRERERRLQDEVSISTLQQQVSDLQSKLHQESKLFKSEAMRKDQESLKLRKRYEERMKSFWDQNTKKWEIVASSVEEALASLEWLGER